MRKHLGRLFAAALSTGFAVCAAAQVPAGVRDVGSTELLLVYRCAPSDRPALRSYMQQRGLAKLAGLRAEGMLTGEKVLFSRYVDTDEWDMLVFLDFANPAAAARWKEVERTNPAGLDPDALKLVTSLASYPLDLMQEQTAPKPVSNPGEKPVYVVLAYDYTVSPDEYIAYLHDYVRPQTSGWIDEGVLGSYRMFVGRDSGGKPWSSVLLLEYKSDSALGARAAAIAKVRARLYRDPAWKAISDRKRNVRVEKAVILADELK